MDTITIVSIIFIVFIVVSVFSVVAMAKKEKHEAEEKLRIARAREEREQAIAKLLQEKAKEQEQKEKKEKKEQAIAKLLQEKAEKQKKQKKQKQEQEEKLKLEEYDQIKKLEENQDGNKYVTLYLGTKRDIFVYQDLDRLPFEESTEVFVPLRFNFSDKQQSRSIFIEESSKRFLCKGDIICRIESFNEWVLKSDYFGVFVKNSAKELKNGFSHYESHKIEKMPLGKLYPCVKGTEKDTIKKIEEYEEKELLKEKLLKEHRKRTLEKEVVQELIESGLIFPESNNRAPIPRDIVDAVWTRDAGKCVFCGSTEKLQIDHIIPFSKGGSDDIANLQILCQKCNLAKSNKIG